MQREETHREIAPRPLDGDHHLWGPAQPPQPRRDAWQRRRHAGAVSILAAACSIPARHVFSINKSDKRPHKSHHLLHTTNSWFKPPPPPPPPGAAWVCRSIQLRNARRRRRRLFFPLQTGAMNDLKELQFECICIINSWFWKLYLINLWLVSCIDGFD